MTSLELEARLNNLLSTAQSETADIDLFTPLIITEREECPICLIPLPIEEEENVFFPCCGKRICTGCTLRSINDSIKNGTPKLQALVEQKCAFCRLPSMRNNNYTKPLKKQMKKKNPYAFLAMAQRYQDGEGVIQSYTKSVEMYIRAAELANAGAFSMIGIHYYQGIAVVQDTSKSLEFYNVAAKKGDIKAHKYLAKFHGRNGDIKTSIEHLKVAAGAGDKAAMDHLMIGYKAKILSKEDLTHTLRAYQASSNEMKSKDRDDARCEARTAAAAHRDDV